MVKHKNFRDIVYVSIQQLEVASSAFLTESSVIIQLCDVVDRKLSSLISI